MEARHHTALCGSLMSLQEEDRYTDFQIVPADGRPIPCHKVVMAAMSPFFDGMLNNQMRENILGSVELPFDAKTVELVLKYIYTGQNVITKDSVTGLYHAAHYLQIASLVEDCKTFLKDGIDETTSLEVWIVSKKFGDKEVAEISRSIVLKGFRMVCTVDDMSIVPLDYLQDLFQDPFLNCTGPSKCEAAWLWLAAREEADPDPAKAESLLKALMSAENVDNSDIIEACSNKIENFSDEEIAKLREVWQGACKKLWINAGSSASAAVYDKEECFIVVGCEKSGHSKLFAFDFKKKKWYDLEAAPRELGHRYAVCSRDSMLYISGGTPARKTFLWFDGDTKQWSSLPDMPTGREQHVMCTMKNKIYVLGGSSRSDGKLWDVHIYSCVDNRWSKCGQVACPVVAACGVKVEDNIILLGGSEAQDGRAPSDTLQCYSTTTNTGSQLHVSLPFKTKSHTMAATNIGSSIYIVYKAEIYTLELFVRKPREDQHRRLPGYQKMDPKVEKLGPIKLQKPPVKGFAVQSFGNKVLIFGGEDDGYSTKKSIIQYDTDSKQAVLLPLSMPESMKDFCYTKLQVPRSWAPNELD